MSLNNFLKQIDPTLHKQYTLEKFKEGHTGKSFVVEEPEFEFKKPVFRKKIDLPKASDYKISYEYLTKRGLDPQKFTLLISSWSGLIRKKEHSTP